MSGRAGSCLWAGSTSHLALCQQVTSSVFVTLNGNWVLLLGVYLSYCKLKKKYSLLYSAYITALNMCMLLLYAGWLKTH